MNNIYRLFRSYKVVLLVLRFSVSVFCCFKTRKVFLSQILHQVLTSRVCSHNFPTFKPLFESSKKKNQTNKANKTKLKKKEPSKTGK